MELYETDLQAAIKLMDELGKLSSIDGVFDIEIRVRLGDVDDWLVIGWGEAGDPCLLRIEEQAPPPQRTAQVYTINPGHSPPWSGTHGLSIDEHKRQ